MISATGLTKAYGALQVLRGVDLSVAPGEVVALLGSSGAGKTTLLHLLGTLDKPDQGTVRFEGQDLFRLSERQRARFRNERLGFVFQFHHLLDEFTALENVAMPAYIRGLSTAEANRKATVLLDRLGLSARLTHRPQELSGGEQQRVAVARALVNEPRLILADEPTGNLDAANAHGLFSLLVELAAERGVACLVATHHAAFGQLAHRVIRLHQGLLANEQPVPTPQVS